MFKVIVLKLLELPFLRRRREEAQTGLVSFTEDDDLDLALYYLRTLTNIFRWAPDPLWVILARKTISSESNIPFFSDISGFRLPLTWIF
jgi:hypothetical protein